jgi:hypothetical protein
MQARFWRIVAGTLTATVVLWGADPIIGTWKLNPAKSKDTARRIPTSLTYTYIAQEGGRVKLTRDEISDKGQTNHSEWSGKFDGADYPDTGNPGMDAMAVKQIDDRTFEVTAKKQGNVIATQRTLISEDGKTLTNTNSSKDEQGQPRSYTAVFEKQ